MINNKNISHGTVFIGFILNSVISLKLYDNYGYLVFYIYFVCFFINKLTGCSFYIA